MYRMVEFPSQGATLRGRYYAPLALEKPLPVIIMAHGYSATINGMVADRYAEGFCEAGFAVLLYDHINFGISDGRPRQQINKWIQARGYYDAITYVSSLPEIDADRIAVWGDSLSGAEVLVVSALDPRIKAVIAQVPACGAQPAPPDPDGTLFHAIQETFLHGDLAGMPHTTKGPLPVVSFSQGSIPSLLLPLTAFRWFIEYGGRYGTKWENWATLVVPETPAPFHPGLCAAHIHAPLLMLISVEDEMPGANSTVARQVYATVPGHKELVDIDGGHFGLLYYPGSIFDDVSQRQEDFLKRCLPLS